MLSLKIWNTKCDTFLIPIRNYKWDIPHWPHVIVFSQNISYVCKITLWIYVQVVYNNTYKNVFKLWSYHQFFSLNVIKYFKTWKKLELKHVMFLVCWIQCAYLVFTYWPKWFSSSSVWEKNSNFPGPLTMA